MKKSEESVLLGLMQRKGPKGTRKAHVVGHLFGSRGHQNSLVYKWRELKSTLSPGHPSRSSGGSWLGPEKIKAWGYIAREARDIGFVPMWARQALKIDSQQIRFEKHRSVPAPSTPVPLATNSQVTLRHTKLDPLSLLGWSNISSFCFLPPSISHLTSPSSSACSFPLLYYYLP